MLDYQSAGEVFLTVTKKNCIPIEESFQIIQPNNNINLSLEVKLIGFDKQELDDLA